MTVCEVLSSAEEHAVGQQQRIVSCLGVRADKHCGFKDQGSSSVSALLQQQQQRGRQPQTGEHQTDPDSESPPLILESSR